MTYIPQAHGMTDDAVRDLVAAVGSGWLVTASAGTAPSATLLPVLWDDDLVVAHMAKANSHWREIGDGVPARLIVTGPEAYVSPSWYASKAEHGRVVPTWNYVAVQLVGRARIHRDAAWLREAVTRLTDRHERDRVDPWHVDDAPDDYVAAMLEGIVGIELRVESVEAKAKLSQNRSAADQAGVVAGLDGVGEPAARAVADAMRSAGTRRATGAHVSP